MYFQEKYWGDGCPHGVLTQRYQHPTKVYLQNGVVHDYSFNDI